MTATPPSDSSRRPPAPTAPSDQGADEGLALFDAGRDERPRPGLLATVGVDPRVLAVGIGAAGLVMAMVTVLSVVNHGVVSVSTAVLALITVLVLVLAWRFRAGPPSVSIVRGVVTIERGGDVHRFDLRDESLPVTMSGGPADADWTATFGRRGLPDVTIDASSIDPYEFVAAMRAYRSAPA